MTVMNRSKDQVAKAIIPMPYWIVNPLLEAV
jgi:hypothetical protein